MQNVSGFLKRPGQTFSPDTLTQISTFSIEMALCLLRLAKNWVFVVQNNKTDTYHQGALHHVVLSKFSAKH